MKTLHLELNNRLLKKLEVMCEGGIQCVGFFVCVHVIYCLVTFFGLQQNQKTKDLMEDLEVAILKTCQCMNELKREVSTV